MKKIMVGYQGEPGAFSEQAARAAFGTKATPKSFGSFKEVFQFVAADPAHYGIVPIENSLFGSIHQNYDLLMKYNVFIVGEEKLRIELNVVGLPGSSLKKVRSLFSQTQALGQCESFLHSLKNVEVVAYHDTAGAAKHVSEQGKKEYAAISSASAAKEYGLSILKRNVEDNHHNFTRFIVLSQKPVAPKKQAKTTIVFAVKDIPGALFKSLAVFALRDVNLLKIESRPLVGRPWEYLFYLDVEGRPTDLALKQALNHLQEVSILVRVLGTYEPAANR